MHSAKFSIRNGIGQLAAQGAGCWIGEWRGAAAVEAHGISRDVRAGFHLPGTAGKCAQEIAPQPLWYLMHSSISAIPSIHSSRSQR